MYIAVLRHHAYDVTVLPKYNLLVVKASKPNKREFRYLFFSSVNH